MRAASLALLTAAALALGACGGDDPGPTRAQFIAATDKRCEASNTRTRSLNAELERAETRASGDKDLLRRLDPILRRGSAAVSANAAALRAETAPSADAAAIKRIRAAYDEQAAIARRLAAAAKGGKVEDFNSLIEEQREVVARARKLTRDYGFRQCGSSKSDAG